MLFPEEHPSFTNSSVWGWLIIYCQVYVTADVHQTEMYVYGFTTAFWQEMRWTYSPAALSLSLGSVGEKLFGDFTNATLAALSLLTCCICQVVSVRWFVHKLYCKWCNRRSFIFLPVCQTSLSFFKILKDCVFYVYSLFTFVTFFALGSCCIYSLSLCVFADPSTGNVRELFLGAGWWEPICQTWSAEQSCSDFWFTKNR